MTQHTLRKARGGIEIDTPLPELDALKILQLRIDDANRLIFLGNLPTIVGLAKDMEERARADVWKIIAHNAHELNGVTK